ncbi:uracil-DNA glycosylase family protein [Ornithinimicrobium sp. Arc0846-15]|nr:uracil-DNA glycosylase family protein [Ornithinimicrobium laminariae]
MDEQPRTGRDVPALLNTIRACRICRDEPWQPNNRLPHEPRPVLRASDTARVVIIGQAPGRKVHESGVPWDDASGARLRTWLGMPTDQFYDEAQVAIVPMGFCYPGKAKSGDARPRAECAPTWHDLLMSLLPADRLTILIGRYAQQRYLPQAGSSVTQAVGRWAEFLPATIVLPHPSPRNVGWFKANPWFEQETIPAVQARMAQLTDGFTER